METLEKYDEHTEKYVITTGMRVRKERKLVPGACSPQLSITTACSSGTQTTHCRGSRTEGGDGEGGVCMPGVPASSPSSGSLSLRLLLSKGHKHVPPQ